MGYFVLHSCARGVTLISSAWRSYETQITCSANPLSNSCYPVQESDSEHRLSLRGLRHRNHSTRAKQTKTQGAKRWQNNRTKHNNSEVKAFLVQTWAQVCFYSALHKNVALCVCACELTRAIYLIAFVITGGPSIALPGQRDALHFSAPAGKLARTAAQVWNTDNTLSQTNLEREKLQQRLHYVWLQTFMIYYATGKVSKFSRRTVSCHQGHQCQCQA